LKYLVPLAAIGIAYVSLHKRELAQRKHNAIERSLRAGARHVLKSEGKLRAGHFADNWLDSNVAKL
jgi:hypothetical protein